MLYSVKLSKCAFSRSYVCVRACVCVCVQLQLESLRTLCYDNADVFLLCFSVVRVSSFDAVATRWLPEVRRLCPRTPVLLVGTQCDRRAAQTGPAAAAVVTDERAAALADRVGAVAYLPCSASLPLGVKDVFDAAIAVSLRRRGLLPAGAGVGRGGVWTSHWGRRPLSDLLRRDADCPLQSYDRRLESPPPAARTNGKQRWKRLLCCITGD